MGQYWSSALPDYNPDEYISATELDLNPANYPNCGNYPWQATPLNELAALPIVEQAKFSDAICRRYAKNAKFHELMKTANGSTRYSLADLNETTIGNSAFMVLNNPGDEYWLAQYNAIIALCAPRDEKN